jgi:hypothetical protein
MSELLTFPSSASGLDFTSGHPGAVVMRIRLSIPIQHQLGILRIPCQQASASQRNESAKWTLPCQWQAAPGRSSCIDAPGIRETRT